MPLKGRSVHTPKFKKLKYIKQKIYRKSKYHYDKTFQEWSKKGAIKTFRYF